MRWLAVLALVVAGAATVGCEPTPAGGAPVRISFDQLAVGPGAPFSTVANDGTGSVAASVVASGGGSLTRTGGRRGGADIAARLPAFDPWAPAKMAALVVRNTGSADALNPGSGRFTFGADFTLDATTADQSAASMDDGDNLVQRGLWGDVSQYKLELDARRPTCRVKGRSGTVSVTAGIAVVADRWYRAVCTRDGSQVSLSVTRWSASGAATTQTWSKGGPTGDLTPASPTVALTVGAKLADSAIDADPDQFNGRVDAVRLELS